MNPSKPTFEGNAVLVRRDTSGARGIAWPLRELHIAAELHREHVGKRIGRPGAVLSVHEAFTWSSAVRQGVRSRFSGRSRHGFARRQGLLRESLVKPPDHDSAAKQRVPSRIIATWPVGTFIENIAAREDGSLVVSIVTGKELALVQPRVAPRRLCTLPGSPFGLAFVGAELFVSAGEPGQSGWAIYRVSGDGDVEKAVEIPRLAS
jgi:hypothetical protein